MSDSYLIHRASARTPPSSFPDEGEGTLLPERALMPKRKRNPVIVTRADGSQYEIPAYDRRALRFIRENPLMTEVDRARLMIACPACGSRAGRVCRSPHGRPTQHLERIHALRAMISPGGRQESDTMGPA